MRSRSTSDLPDVDGWELLDQLKRDPATKSIPVHVISGEEQWQRALDSGAFAHLKKPASEEALTDGLRQPARASPSAHARNVLVVEDDVTQLSAMANLIRNGEVAVTAVCTGAEALRALDESRFDCVIVDLGLPDIDGVTLIEQIKRQVGHERVPVIVYTGRDLSTEEDTALRRLSESVIIKDVDVARAPDRGDDLLPQPGRSAAPRAPSGRSRPGSVDLARRPQDPHHRRRHRATSSP